MDRANGPTGRREWQGTDPFGWSSHVVMIESGPGVKQATEPGLVKVRGGRGR